MSRTGFPDPDLSDHLPMRFLPSSLRDCTSTPFSVSNLVDPPPGLFDVLKRQGLELRLARSAQGQVNICRALSWSASGTFSFEPHDDVAQVLCAGNEYDLSAVANNTVAAPNFYPSIAEEGGNLRLWSHKPTVADRESQGVETTGVSLLGSLSRCCSLSRLPAQGRGYRPNSFTASVNQESGACC